MGYLRKDKGIQYLIEAFGKINKGDAILWIVGDGEYKKELEKLAKGHRNIKFFGYAEGVEKANYYSIADFFIFPPGPPGMLRYLDMPFGMRHQPQDPPGYIADSRNVLR